MLRRSVLALSILAVTIALAPTAWAQVTQPIPPGTTPPPGYYSYAVKFVCGFQPTNVGIMINPDGSTTAGGEPTVKAGNYATDINIFNPSKKTGVDKKVLVLVDGESPTYPPVGREPKFVRADPEFADFIELDNCTSTMDDCNRILEILQRPPSTSLLIGFLVLESEQPLDVTAVYTAEICSDMPFLGPAGGCTNINTNFPGFASFGGGLSIDVEQVDGKYITEDQAGDK